jgi:hypothetical protein
VGGVGCVGCVGWVWVGWVCRVWMGGVGVVWCGGVVCGVGVWGGCGWCGVWGGCVGWVCGVGLWGGCGWGGCGVGDVVVWGVGGVGCGGVGGGREGGPPLRSNIPRSALCATLDTYATGAPFANLNLNAGAKVHLSVHFVYYKGEKLQRKHPIKAETRHMPQKHNF